MTDRQKAEFWSRVDRCGPDECWEWTSSRNKWGYGNFMIHAKRYTATRIMMALQHGAMPVDRLVCHTCDNPPCMNPRHLFTGTSRDNVMDAVKKGRLYKHAFTHCYRGHEYTPENTYISPGTGGRHCQACLDLRTQVRLGKLPRTALAGGRPNSIKKPLEGYEKRDRTREIAQRAALRQKKRLLQNGTETTAHD